MAVPEQKVDKDKRDDSQDVYKEGMTNWSKRFQEVAGIKNYKNCTKVKKDQKGMLLIQAYVAGQSISWDTSKTAKGGTTNNELVEHKDKSPSMVDKIAKTS